MLGTKHLIRVDLQLTLVKMICVDLLLAVTCSEELEEVTLKLRRVIIDGAP